MLRGCVNNVLRGWTAYMIRKSFRSFTNSMLGIILFIYLLVFEHRWNLEYSWNSSFHCHMRNHPLDFWWTASFDFGSCRADSYYVQLLVHFCQRKARDGEGAVSSLGCMVRKFTYPLFFSQVIWCLRIILN